MNNLNPKTKCRTSNRSQNKSDPKSKLSYQPKARLNLNELQTESWILNSNLTFTIQITPIEN